MRVAIGNCCRFFGIAALALSMLSASTSYASESLPNCIDNGGNCGDLTEGYTCASQPNTDCQPDSQSSTYYCECEAVPGNPSNCYCRLYAR